MAEPVNHTLHVLREFREEFREFATKTEKRFDTLERKVDRNHEELKQRIENLRRTLGPTLSLVRGAPDGGA
jgi:hypothetical protein